MNKLTRTFVAAVSLVVSATAAMGEVKAVWVGQVEKDFVGPSATIAPSDTQDLQIRLEGLAPDKRIENIRVLRAGGGEWQYNGPWGPYGIHMERAEKATTADLFLEPSHDEEGVQWDIHITYDDQTKASTSVITGKSQSKLRMPDAMLTAEWLGQDGRDWTGRYPAVGPDGIQDVVLRINGLSDKLGVLKAIRVEAEGGPIWEYGVNPDKVWNAEIFRESPKSRTAEMLISPPEQSIAGKPLKLTVWYGHNRDHMFEGSAVAGESDAALKTELPTTYTVHRLADFSADWRGQPEDGTPNRGDVQVRVGGLPAGANIVAASLSDSQGGHWVWRKSEDVDYYTPQGGEYVPPVRAMVFQTVVEDPTQADLYFPPFRDETDTSMTFRIMLENGGMHFGQFTGQAADVTLRGQQPNDKSITAKPGDDLHALVAEYGRINLSPGIYELDRQLRIPNPITLTGPRDAIVRFSQLESDDRWNAAIYLAGDNTTLDGFSIRFAGPIRWATDDWTNGCAIIFTELNPDRTGDLVNLVIRNMDIETSPIPDLEDPSKPVWVPNLIRSGRYLTGSITHNTFLGGTVDVTHGPWVVSDNLHRGAPANGVTWDAFAGHYLNDLTMERNRLHADLSPGKLWRFLVLTQWSANAIVRDNDVRGVGMRDDDPMPNPNAPEIFLTEAYRLHYEGKPAYRSDDGHVVQIPVLMWGSVRPGSVVAILDGEHAGKWFKIAQPIDPITFLLDQPIPEGDYAISIATGMVDELYENNRIDVRGGSSSTFQLCATVFNTVVRNNHIIGGGAFIVQGVPTEFPGVWGWSMCPMFDMVVEGNTLEDTRKGMHVYNGHSTIHTKSVPGRLYSTVTLTGNTITWSDDFAQWRTANPPEDPAKAKPLHAITLGTEQGPEPGDLRIEAAGNHAHASDTLRESAVVSVRNTVLNDQPVVEDQFSLAPPPAAAAGE